MSSRYYNTNFFIFVIGTVIMLLIVWGLVSYADYARKASIQSVGEADFVVNDGRSVHAQNYSVIIDQRTGMQYLYFPGIGVTPYLDKNGDPMRVVD